MASFIKNGETNFTGFTATDFGCAVYSSVLYLCISIPPLTVKCKKVKYKCLQFKKIFSYLPTLFYASVTRNTHSIFVLICHQMRSLSVNKLSCIMLLFIYLFIYSFTHFYTVHSSLLLRRSGPKYSRLQHSP
jgi:hypothetical protein